MVPPRRFSDIAGDISYTERPKRQRLSLDKNGRFDQMMQSISAVDRNSHNHRRNDAYSPSTSTTLTSELSLIKRTRISSESASKASSSSHTCNPLPQWLVNTFMTLSKKNPLRLLLPSDISESEFGSVLHPQTETTAQPIDVSASGPSSTWNLREPDTQISEYPIGLPETSPVSDDHDQESWQEPLPFSTPGPGSLLGSSVTSNTDLSFPILKKKKSPVLYAQETHIGSNLPSNRSHIPLYSSDSLHSDPCIEDFATDEACSSYKTSIPEEDPQSLFSTIYSTPGPRYCAPRPVHFDSPFEDPMISDTLQPGYEMDCGAIDFHWKPFDRKSLVRDRLQKPIYASGPAHSTDTSEHEHEEAVKSVNTETSTLNSHITPPLLSISPTPFRFFVPPENDALTPLSKSQAVKKPSTPKKSPYFEVPGVYISPLDEHRRMYLARRDEDTGNGSQQANSQASNDSIESW